MRATKALVAVLIGFCLTASSARAADTIAPGTKITMQNWQQYKDFMPQGLQTMLSGTTVWKVPADAVLEVGPTVDYPLPKSWYDAGEKYKNQTKLKKTDAGGYTLEGYQSGTPFPDYSEPDKAYKILYDLYYHYGGSIDYYQTDGYEIDRYQSAQINKSYQVFL